MELYLGILIFSTYLGSLETPQVPKRSKKKDKPGQNTAIFYPNITEDLEEKSSKKKPLLARAIHKSIKRIKSNDFNSLLKKTSPKPQIDHQIGNSSFFKKPVTIGEVYKLEPSEDCSQYCF